MNEKILAFIEKENIEQAKWDNEQLERELEHRAKEISFNEFRLNNLRKATVKDYEKWLKKWLIENNITHYYDYNYPDNNYVATRDFVLDIGYYGAQSFNIIVPKGISYEIIKIGHCNIYDINNITHVGFWIPCYCNVRV